MPLEPNQQETMLKEEAQQDKPTQGLAFLMDSSTMTYGIVEVGAHCRIIDNGVEYPGQLIHISAKKIVFKMGKHEYVFKNMGKMQRIGKDGKLK